MEFLTIREHPGLFIDALVADHSGELLFLSVFGNHSLLLQWQARLTLTDHLDALDYFWVEGYGQINVSYKARLTKATSRIPDSQFVQLGHLWVYDKQLTVPDIARASGFLLHRHDEAKESLQERLWQAVRLWCPIPLHERWHALLPVFIQHQWIRHYQGVGVDVYHITLEDAEVASVVSDWLKRGKLPSIW